MPHITVMPAVHWCVCARGCAGPTAVGRVLCGRVAVGRRVLTRTLESGCVGVGVLCVGVHRAGGGVRLHVGVQPC